MPPLVTTVSVGLAIVAVSLLAVRTPTRLAAGDIEATTLRCTNPYSGAIWNVAIDPSKGTADSFPADITDQSIEWRDTIHGGRFEFDRASGELTVTYASSMGGTFLRDECRVLRESEASSD